MAGSPRQYHHQLVHYLRKGFTYADHGQTLTVGYLPAGAVFLKPLSGVVITTAFNGSPQRVDFGPSTDASTDLWATILNVSTTTFVPFDENVSALVVSDTVAQAYIHVSTGSAGEGELIITYVVDNDG